MLSGGLTCNWVRGLRDARKMESDLTSQCFTSHGFQGVLCLLNTCFMIRLSCGLNETFVMYLAKILGPKKHSVFLLYFYFLFLFFIAWMLTDTALTLSCVNGELSRICISDGKACVLTPVGFCTALTFLLPWQNLSFPLKQRSSASWICKLPFPGPSGGLVKTQIPGSQPKCLAGKV